MRRYEGRFVSNFSLLKFLRYRVRDFAHGSRRLVGGDGMRS